MFGFSFEKTTKPLKPFDFRGFVYGMDALLTFNHSFCPYDTVEAIFPFFEAVELLSAFPLDLQAHLLSC